MSCFSHKHQSLWLFLWVDWLLLMLYGEGVIRRFRDVRRSAGVKYVVYTRNLMVLHILDHWHSSYLSLSVICPSSKGLLYHFFSLSSQFYIQLVCKTTLSLTIKFKQSCSVSKETFDLTVTRWTLWFKSANIIILCWTKASLW